MRKCLILFLILVYAFNSEAQDITYTPSWHYVNTPHGNFKLGPNNSSWAHIYTDRPAFIFDKPIYSLGGKFSAYSSTNLELQTSGSTRLTILQSSGNVGIGITNPSEKLSVNGTIRSKEVLVESTPWPDYVFSDTYKLNSLSEVSTFISENGHLPNIPTAKEVKENGIKLGEMNAKLLEKIEELTLYQIQLLEMLHKHQKEIEILKSNVK